MILILIRLIQLLVFAPFGDDKYVVTQKAIAFMRGLHDVGVLSCAKHFPGHGDTSVDSHLQLPVLYHNKDRLYEIEIWPFIKMIEAQVPAIMVGHLAVPAFDKTGEPASLSKVVIQNILRHELKFDGLVITDGLGMRAITNHYKPGELELKALLAGNDILLCPLNVPKAVEKIKCIMSEGLIKMEEVDAHVRRILLTKKKVLR